jgi:RNA polymerase sigma factor (sigma-70 family)
VDQELYHLIKESKSGNEDAYANLVTKYKGQVFRHAYAMMNDRMDAEDIAQEAFIKAYFSLPKLDNEYAFTSWLTRIVSNICMDKIKGIQKNKIVQEEKKMDVQAMATSAAIDRSHIRLSIQEALETLSAEHRMVLVLRDMQGYSYDEIAKILKIPIGTVKSRINSSRIALRNELSRGDENE